MKYIFNSDWNKFFIVHSLLDPIQEWCKDRTLVLLLLSSHTVPPSTHVSANSTMETCPHCSYRGKSLRKHLSKALNCKRLFQHGQQSQESNAAKRKPPPFQVIEILPQDDVVFSSNDGIDDCSWSSTIITEREKESDENQSNASCLTDGTSIGCSLAVMPKLSSHGFTIDQYCETDLAKLLNDKHVPHGLYQDILEWAHRAKRMKYSFQPKRLQRSTLIRHLSSWQEKQNRRPSQKKVSLPGAPTLEVSVTCYDFKTELLSLLESSVFNNIDNLDVNVEDPFSAYKSSSRRINCFNSGKWYLRSHKRMCKNVKKDFFLPIIFSYDESVLKNGSASIAPLKFTTSILNQTERNKGSNWRTLCLIPDLTAFESKAQRSEQSPQTKSQRLHALFRAGMESYIKCEQDQCSVLKNVMLRLGDVTKQRNIKIACGLVLGDIQGGDKICCRSASYKSTMNRICRKCTIPGDKCSDLTYECRKISMKSIKELVANKDEQKLSKINQYCVDSVWYDLTYGGCRFGIFSAANPTEWLHALDNGLIQHCLNDLNEHKMTVQQSAKMDEIVMHFLEMPRQHLMTANSNSDFPRLLWKNGISTLTDITADHKVGMLLTFVVASLTTKGQKLLVTAFGTQKQVKSVQTAFQKLLAYRSWLRKSEFWKVDNSKGKENAKKAIQKCLGYLQKHFPREEGQGWNIPKFHEQLHVPDDISRNGPPATTYTGVVEHQHVIAKQHAERTRKNRHSLDKELGARQFETVVINDAHAIMQTRLDCLQKERCKVPKMVADIRIALTCKCTLLADGTVACNRRDNNVLNDMSNNVLRFLSSEWKLTAGDTFYLIHELKCNQMLYRATKSYWSSVKHGWHDWVMMRFAAEDDEPRYQNEKCKAWFGDTEEVRRHHEYAPGRILAMVSKLDPDNIKTAEEVTAIMETCEFRHKPSSLFTTLWNAAWMYQETGTRTTRKIKRLELVNPCHFVGHCLMIPENDANEKFHQVWHPKLWADVHHKDE